MRLSVLIILTVLLLTEATLGRRRRWYRYRTRRWRLTPTIVWRRGTCVRVSVNVSHGKRSVMEPDLVDAKLEERGVLSVQEVQTKIQTDLTAKIKDFLKKEEVKLGLL